MKSSMREKVKILAAGAVLVLVGGYAFCQLTPLCPVHAATNNRTIALSRTIGEKDMFPSVAKPPKIQHATDANFEDLVLGSKVPVLVDFYADWCGPCRAVAPLLEQLAAETRDAKIAKVNVDDSPELAARYGINAIPSLLVFADGGPVARHVGLADKQKLKALMQGRRS